MFLRLLQSPSLFFFMFRLCSFMNEKVGNQLSPRFYAKKFCLIDFVESCWYWNSTVIYFFNCSKMEVLISHLWIVVYLFDADHWGVPKVSFRPSYSEIFWGMHRSQNKAWSLFQTGSKHSLFSCSWSESALYISSWILVTSIEINFIAESCEAKGKLWRE